MHRTEFIPILEAHIEVRQKRRENVNDVNELLHIDDNEKDSNSANDDNKESAETQQKNGSSSNRSSSDRSSNIGVSDNEEEDIDLDTNINGTTKEKTASTKKGTTLDDLSSDDDE